MQIQENARHDKSLLFFPIFSTDSQSCKRRQSRVRRKAPLLLQHSERGRIYNKPVAFSDFIEHHRESFFQGSADGRIQRNERRPIMSVQSGFSHDSILVSNEDTQTGFRSFDFSGQSDCLSIRSDFIDESTPDSRRTVQRQPRRIFSPDSILVIRYGIVTPVFDATTIICPTFSCSGRTETSMTLGPHSEKRSSF